MVSCLAIAFGLTKLLIERGIITEAEFIEMMDGLFLGY